MEKYQVINNCAVLDESNGRRELRVFAPDLKAMIPYIIEEQITEVAVWTMDPAALYQWSVTHEETEFRKMKDSNVDISPLALCPQIEWLALEGDLVNSDVLEKLPKLRSLSIDNDRRKNPVRLDGLRSLHTLWLTKPGKNIIGLSECTGLKELRIWNYAPKLRDLSELSQMKNLESLCLIQPRIDSVNGIERLAALKNFEIYYSRTLKDIAALEMRSDIENVVLEHVPKIIPPSRNDTVW